MALQWQKNPRGTDGWFAWDNHGFTDMRTRTLFRATKISKEFWVLSDLSLHEFKPARTLKECKRIAFDLTMERMP